MLRAFHVPIEGRPPAVSRPCGGWPTILTVAFVLLTLVPPVAAQDTGQRRVLVLYGTMPGASGMASMAAAYQRVLGGALGNRLDLHSEFIDFAHFSEPAYQSALADWLRYKYTRLPLDLIIATNDLALQFVDRSRAKLFPGIPIVFVDRTTLFRPGPGMTGVSAALDLSRTLDLALALQPSTTRVFVVSGVSELDRFYEDLARKQFQRLAGRVTPTYLSGLAMADLEQTVATLPPDSVIYFLTLGQDGAGARFDTIHALDRLSAVANAPIYSWHEVVLNHGVVGGRLYDNAVAGERTAELALRILRGETADSIPVLAIDPYVNKLDSRQLRRWGISEARVPQGATILFREPSLWDQYKVYIAGAVALTFLQTALIAGLLIQNVRRRRVEAALRDNQATLQESHRQISDLFGRLIGAQETERTRIARDLHDDVSQRIAGLSIMISGLKRRLRGQPDEADVIPALTLIQQNTIALSDEIRDLSHDLHPGLLQHAGLVTALGAFCAQFEKQHAIAVTFSASADVEHVEADPALCLYRVAQEALHNVAKHADAGRVSVAVARTEDSVQLSIADDGRGFDLGETRGKAAGLGLISMEERVRLLRGSVYIETQPRGGTRVQVQIPQPHEMSPALDAAPGVTALVNDQV